MADLYLIEFKGSRKEYYTNPDGLELNVNQYVITEADQGEDMGKIRFPINNEMEFDDDNQPGKILRAANEDDVSRYQLLRDNEGNYKSEIRTLVSKHSLDMKIVDVECRFDGNKITFYFTADHRVDFRALVRDLASKYRTRIELRQIGVRDEARRIDGYGICGRRQCCNSHIQEFAPISTQQARAQDLSLNPAKISGNCGRLLCCLAYEVSEYSRVKELFPNPGTKVNTAKGRGVINRIDVFTEEAVLTDREGVAFRVKAAEIESDKPDQQAEHRQHKKHDKQSDRPSDQQSDEQPDQQSDDNAQVSDDSPAE